MTASLVILDYSGTLCFSSVLFGEPERLLRELEASGLWALGIDRPEVFWTRIVIPTWEEGSTTSLGYREAMARQIALLTGRDRSRVHPSASSFVDAYLRSSTIDPCWEHLLVKLASAGGVRTLIATDHYAEATEVIRLSLRSFAIEAVRALAAGSRALSAPFLVANSADIGFHKKQQAFWEKVRRSAVPEEVGQIILVDDFGANEQADDRYASEEQVLGRARDTARVVEEVFQARVEVLPFILPRGKRDEKAFRDLAGQAAEKIARLVG